MTFRSMAVVLCPSLYNACNATPKVLRSVMEFVDFGIQWREKYRREFPTKYEEEFIEDPKIVMEKLEISKKAHKNSDSGNGQGFAYSDAVNKWESVMKLMTVDEMEQQSWHDCVDRDPEDSFDDNLYNL